MSTNDSTLGGEAHVNRWMAEYINHVTGSVVANHAGVTPSLVELARDVWSGARLAEFLITSSAMNSFTITTIRAAVDDLNKNQQSMGEDVKNLMVKVDGLAEQMAKFNGLSEQMAKVDELAEQMAILIGLQEARPKT